MLCADFIRKFRRLFCVHIIAAIDGVKGIIDCTGGKQVGYLLKFGGIARVVEGDTVKGEDIADAVLYIMVGVLRGDSFDFQAVKVKGFIVAVYERFGIGDDGTVFLLLDKVNLIMVIVAVGDEDNVGGGVVIRAVSACVFIGGVDIDNSAVGEGEFHGGVPDELHKRGGRGRGFR